MIVKNDYVKIKTMNKEYTLHNYIYDEYLKRIAMRQYENQDNISEIRNSLKLYRVYIKLDESFESITEKTKNDFNLAVYGSMIQNGNSQTIEIIYDYNCSDKLVDIKTNEIVNIKGYANRKITALGFGNDDILAVLDLSSYSIYVPADAHLTFTRKDIIATDSICVGYKYPVHLALTTRDYVSINDPTGEHLYEKDAKLFSIGFGRVKNSLDEEFVIGKDVELVKKSDTSYSFNLKVDTDRNIYPFVSRYCKSTMFPTAPNFKREIHPMSNLYTGTRMPMISNYKYIIYKFRLCYWDRGCVFHWLDEYYTMNLANQSKGLFEIVTKIERSVNNG